MVSDTEGAWGHAGWPGTAGTAAKHNSGSCSAGRCRWQLHNVTVTGGSSTTSPSPATTHPIKGAIDGWEGEEKQLPHLPQFPHQPQWFIPSSHSRSLKSWDTGDSPGWWQLDGTRGARGRTGHQRPPPSKELGWTGVRTPPCSPRPCTQMLGNM